MDLVVDTNVLFSFFKLGSATREIIKSNNFTLFAPEFAKEELNKYKEDIKEKYSLNEDEYCEFLIELFEYVTFYPKELYFIFLKEVSKFKDQKDLDFLALALFMVAPIWSQDKSLLSQTEIDVKVLSTKDIFELWDCID